MGTAWDLCEKLPDDALLSPKLSLVALQRAFWLQHILHFPVLNSEGICVGLIPRCRLEAVAQARFPSVLEDLDTTSPKSEHCVIGKAVYGSADGYCESMGLFGDEAEEISLEHLINLSPFTILGE